MKRILLLLALCATTHLGAQSPRWTTWDKIGVAAGGALILADWFTTIDATRRGNFVEKNPLLGRDPSEGRINAVVGSWVVVYTASALLLPKEERRMLMAAVIVAETYVVTGQVTLGLRLALP
jgi:hypothetical protein